VLTDLREYFRSSSEDLTRLSIPDRASPVLLLLNRNLYKWRTKSRVWCLEFCWQGERVLLRVPGGVTDLIKSVTRQVLAGQPSHMAGRPWSSASIDCRPRIPDYRLLESVTTKASHERLQSGADRPPMGPTGKWLLHTAS
jgi:hypothetical protein